MVTIPVFIQRELGIRTTSSSGVAIGTAASTTRIDGYTRQEITKAPDAGFAKHPATSGGPFAGVSGMLTRLVQPSPVTTISPEALARGFELKAYAADDLQDGYKHLAGYTVLRAPSTRFPEYTPSIGTPTLNDHFTRLDFDARTPDESETLFIETSRGEKAAYVLDRRNQTLSLYAVDPSGKVTTHSEPYIADTFARGHIASELKTGDGEKLARLNFDPAQRTITATKGFSSQTWQLNIPTWLNFKVVHDHFILISDKMGVGFTGGNTGWGFGSGLIQAFGEKSSQDATTYVANINAYSNDLSRPSISYSVGTMGTGTDSFQELIDIVVEEILHADAMKRTDTIFIGSRPLRVHGPNRNGDYVLSSSTGRSEILYNGSTGIFRLGRGWFDGGQTSRILEFNETTGTIKAEMRNSLGEITVYAAQLQFENPDASVSYVAPKIS